MGRWVKWFIAASFSIAIFAGAWWLLQVGDKIDEGTALGVAVVPFTIAITIGGVLAEETRGEREDSIEATIRSSGTIWPDPSPIRGMKDYKEAFSRTWIAAGTPTDQETEARTGGLVRQSEVSRLREKYSEYRTWRVRDLDSAIIVLQAWRVPEFLINAWKEAGPRAIKGEPRQRQLDARTERTEKRKLLHPHWFSGMLAGSLMCPAISFFTGISYPLISKEARLGAGNWFALVISSIIIVAILSMGLFGLIIDPYYLGKASSVARLAVFACCLGSAYVGWHLTHGTHGISQLDHLSQHVRNWLVWRFLHARHH